MWLIDKLRRFLNGDSDVDDQCAVFEINNLSEAAAIEQSEALFANKSIFQCVSNGANVTNTDLLRRFDEITTHTGNVHFGYIYDNSLVPAGYESFDIVGSVIEDVYLFRERLSGEVWEVDLFDPKNPVFKFKSIYHCLIFYGEKMSLRH